METLEQLKKRLKEFADKTKKEAERRRDIPEPLNKGIYNGPVRNRKL